MPPEPQKSRSFIANGTEPYVTPNGTNESAALAARKGRGRKGESSKTAANLLSGYYLSAKIEKNWHTKIF